MKHLKNYSEYLDHLQNTSPCKTAYTFAKGSRFQRIVSQTPNKFYEPLNGKSKRATSIGFGQKASMENKNCMDPGLYSIRSSFDVNKSRYPNSRNVFGLTHEAIYNRLLKQKNNPGPGQYDVISKQERKFHMGSRLPTHDDKCSPSPQKYEINKEQLDKISKHLKTSTFRIRTEKFDRNLLSLYDNKIPGPGAYNPESQDSIETIIKKSRCARKFTFTKSQRMADLGRNANLGPGSYKNFSVFGNEVNHRGRALTGS